jgi:hypothetical protein
MTLENTRANYTAVVQDQQGRYSCISYGSKKSFEEASDRASKSSRFFRNVASPLEGFDLIDELKAKEK